MQPRDDVLQDLGLKLVLGQSAPFQEFVMALHSMSQLADFAEFVLELGPHVLL
jgi:hypothetical protein